MKTIGFDVTVLNDKQKTGIAVYNYNLLENILKINKTDRFILFGVSNFTTFNFLNDLPFKNYPNVEVKIFKISARIFRTAFLLWQRTGWPPIERFTGSIDIFHSFNFYLPPQKAGKVVATVFDMTPSLFPYLHLEKTIQLDKMRMNRIKKRADLVVTISENSKKDFLKFAPQKRVEVIYPGLSDNFSREIDKSKIRRILRKYNLKSGYILSVGTLEPRKNIKFLIDAYLKSNINRKLVLVGIAGWKNSELLKLIDKNKDRITALGFIPDEDLPYIYSRAECLVYPSLYEGFGLPVLEALAFSIPVICSRSSSLKEVGGDAAYYINPMKENSLINALIEIIKNKKLRRDLTAKGEKQVKKFSWKTSASRLNLLYQQL